MKRVYDSKEPTIKALQNISENLSNHLQTYTQVTITASHSDITSLRYVEYGIYIESDGQATHTFKTWAEALSLYKQLMSRYRRNADV